jgi:hypothetical protein
MEIQLGKYKYVIQHNSWGWYLENQNNSDNAIIFQDLGLDKAEFATKVLGYYDDGNFPFTRSRKDLDKLIAALNEIISDSSITITREQLKEGYDLACSDWKKRIEVELASQLIKDESPILVKKSFIKELQRNAARTDQRRFLNNLFNPNACSSDTLEVGEYMRTTTGRLILKTYNSFVDIDQPNMTWGHEVHTFEGLKVKVTHTVSSI